MLALPLRRPLAPAAALAIVAGAMLLAPLAHACQIPVFRYALERWRADPYAFVVLHDGPLSDADNAVVEKLRQSDITSTTPANLIVEVIGVNEHNDPLLKAIWEKRPEGKAVWSALVYPRLAEVPGPVAWAGPLDAPELNTLIDSPARRQVREGILKGDSAVWLFIPSGDAGKDAAARKLLEAELKHNEKQLELPPQDVIEADEQFLGQTAVELRLGFSIVDLKRDDPAERMFLATLLASAPKLAELDEPIAVPIFGRGRALYPLHGEYFSAQVIEEACAFMIGPCSCQVKELNPGVDLLFAVDWDAAIIGTAIPDKPLPELTGLAALVEVTPVTELDDEGRAAAKLNDEPRDAGNDTEATLVPTDASAPNDGAIDPEQEKLLAYAESGKNSSSVAGQSKTVTPTQGVAAPDGAARGSGTHLWQTILVLLAAGALVILVASVWMRKRDT